jgi:hypothetical protein
MGNSPLRLPLNLTKDGRHWSFSVKQFSFLVPRVLESTWWWRENLLTLSGIEPCYWKSYPELFLVMYFKLPVLQGILLLFLALRFFEWYTVLFWHVIPVVKFLWKRGVISRKDWKKWGRNLQICVSDIRILIF